MIKRYTPAKKVSASQAKRLNKYRPIKDAFLSSNPDCALCGRPAVQVHHGKGKTGDLLFETKYFIPVCDGACHLHLETHPEEARELGLSFKRNTLR